MLLTNGDNRKLFFLGEDWNRTPSFPFLLNTGKGSLEEIRGKPNFPINFGTGTRSSQHLQLILRLLHPQHSLRRRHGSGSSCKWRWVEGTAVSEWILHYSIVFIFRFIHITYIHMTYIYIYILNIYIRIITYNITFLC